MSDMTPEDEALLERARRGGTAATMEDHARVKRRLLAQIGMGAAATAISTSGGASAGLTTAGAASTAWASAAKIVVALAVGAGAGTGVVLTYGARSAHEPRAVPLPASSAPVVAAPVAPMIPRGEPSADPPASEALPEWQPPPPVVRDRAARPFVAATIEPSNAPPPTENAPMPVSTKSATQPEPAGPATVAAEAELLRQADGAVKAGQPARALALLDEHAARFPNGILIEEREAERIVVLCALGRTDEARAAASQFLRARPHSPLGRRVRESCGGT